MNFSEAETRRMPDCTTLMLLIGYRIKNPIKMLAAVVEGVVFTGHQGALTSASCPQ